ncbi:MAG TPA: glycolate oxidase subunit GlcE [Burkholderiaceae bacterium]|nr:glycolate oxidase subunit GlcE [Burkholderiaceae bacterium]
MRDCVRAADADRARLRLHGGGTKDFYGEPSGGEPLDLRAVRGIVSYEPTELVVTVRCGTPLHELETALAERRQFLPFEPPHFGAGATVGGMVAAGLSGPRRATAGAVRDFMLGAVLMDARGELLHFGGQVMKNVAGYDVARLLAGSMGILGPIVQVSLKVLPLPAAEATVTMAAGLRDALASMNRWGGQPLPVSATAWAGGELSVRFSGARAAVDAAVRRFVDEHGATALDPEAAARRWSGLREQTDPFFDGEQPLWRLSVPSTAQAFEFPGRQLVEWGGALRWFRTDADPARVREAAATVGGAATLFRARDMSPGAFAPLPPAVLELHRRLKREFDPRGLFNPGRLVAGL